MMVRLLLVAACAMICNATAAELSVPGELEPWRAWVLHGKEYRDCPFYFNGAAADAGDFVCAWPGQLALSIDAGGGSFEQSWTVYADEQWLPLPGDAAHWPEQVSADGRPAPVVQHGNAPAIRLGAGRHTVSGRYRWDERPRALRVPAESGLLALTIDGVTTERPQWSGGSVWLGRSDAQAAAGRDALDVAVYRLIEDGIPALLTTRLRLEISGSMRETSLPAVLPTGYVPLALDSELPARLEADGTLRLQARPGSWTIVVQARANSVLQSLKFAPPGEDMPDTEIWSYRANDTLRVSVPEGAAPVDPSQVGVPGEWQSLPAFRVQAGDALEVRERSRGRTARDNHLTLDRQLWMDFKGRGFVFSDRIGGEMQSNWRLDMQPPYALLSATENGDDLLVTSGANDGDTGVEVRSTVVDLQATGRSETEGRMPATGWRTPFESVNTMLYLPPGELLLAAPGTDRTSTSWVDAWKLLDFFVVLIVTIAVARLYGRGAGVLALAALTLSLHEPYAAAFSWLNLLIAVALVRVAPPGRLLQACVAYRALSFVLLLFIFIPFAASQLRIAVFPQLQAGSANMNTGVAMESAPMDDYAASPANSGIASVKRADRDALQEVVVTGSRTVHYSRYAPNSVVQVGPGRPAWQFNSYRLDWSGPVVADQAVHLVVLPRWLVTACRFLEVLLLAALLGLIAREFRRRPAARVQAGPATGVAVMLCLAAIVPLTLLASAQVRADTPSPAILGQLEERLTRPPDCVPRCADIASAEVQAGGERLTITLTIDAVEAVAVSLPGSMAGWRPEQLRLDGSNAALVMRDPRQVLWLQVAAGRHVVVLSGRLPPVDSLEVPFPTPPHAISARSGDWRIDGIRDRQLASGSLQLTRLERGAGSGDTARWEASRFPAYLRVVRQVDFDLDWRVTTTAYRVAPAEGAISLPVPLIAGEAVVTDGVQVRDGAVIVAMPPDRNQFSWQSTLPRQSPLVLEASADAAFSETWRFGIGSVWHATFDGVPESPSPASGDGYRAAVFYPRPGETLDVALTRPDASAGDSLVFDRVNLATRAGERSGDSTLVLEYRSTRGTQHALRLPPDAQLTSVAIDGSPAALDTRDGELQIPVLPGSHAVSIAWHDGSASGLRTALPAVSVGAGAANIDLALDVPANRWILATSGPRVGPAVLYWSELLVMLLLAFVLGRVRQTPLSTLQWLLLGLGFSTFSWGALTFVVVWLLFAGVQPSLRQDAPRWRHNTLQVAMALITIVALATIVISVPSGLLGRPDMHIIGNGSYGNALRWFADRSSTGELPGAFALTLPLWVYKALILGWALWLSFALLRWLPWAWRQFASGALWLPRAAMSTGRPE